MQKPNPRQRQPVNVGLLEVSLNDLRNKLLLDVANRTIKLMGEWHEGYVQPGLKDLEAHLLWHATPWYGKLWCWIRDLWRKPVEEEEPELIDNDAVTPENAESEPTSNQAG